MRFIPAAASLGLACLLMLPIAQAQVPPPAKPATAEQSPASSPAMPAASAAAPAFTLPDQDGRPVSLADHAGKLVVLEWINWDCPYVRHHYEAGTMKKLADKFGELGVVWLAINSTHYATADKDREWIARYALPYPILRDPDGKVGKAFGARTTPHMYVLDHQGRIVYQGAIDDDPRLKGQAKVNHVERAITALLLGQQLAVANTTPYGCSVKYKD